LARKIAEGSPQRLTGIPSAQADEGEMLVGGWSERQGLALFGMPDTSTAASVTIDFESGPLGRSQMGLQSDCFL